MTTILPTYQEGYRHHAAGADAGWIPMLTANFTEIEPAYLGPLAPRVYVPGNGPRQVVRAMQLAGQVPLRLDVGGWAFKRILDEATMDDICRGLDTGVWPCASEIARWVPFAGALRAAGLMPHTASGIKPTAYSDWEPGAFSVPASLAPNVAQAVAIYRAGNAVSDTTINFRQQRAMVGTVRTVLQASGFDGDNFAIASICNCETFHGTSWAVEVPISMVEAGGITPGYPDWPSHWTYIQGCASTLSANGSRWVMALDAAMPPVQATIGMVIAQRFNAEYVQMFTSNTTDEATMAPLIQAIAQAIGTTHATGV